MRHYFSNLHWDSLENCIQPQMDGSEWQWVSKWKFQATGRWWSALQTIKCTLQMMWRRSHCERQVRDTRLRKSTNELLPHMKGMFMSLGGGEEWDEKAGINLLQLHGKCCEKRKERWRLKKEMRFMKRNVPSECWKGRRTYVRWYN